MRIDAYNQISQVYGVNGKMKTNATSKTYNTDKVEISSFGKELQIAKKAVAESEDVRSEKVAELKSKFDNNTYQFDASDFADMLIRKYQEI